MINAGILPVLIGLAVDSPYDLAEASKRACTTLENLSAAPAMAALMIKVKV
jgi:hypothetical protein